MNMKKIITLCVTSVLFLPVIAGCKSETPTMSEAEKSNFKGGPMPPEAAAKMQERMKKAGMNNPGDAPPGSQGGGAPAGGAPAAGAPAGAPPGPASR